MIRKWLAILAAGGCAGLIVGGCGTTAVIAPSSSSTTAVFVPSLSVPTTPGNFKPPEASLPNPSSPSSNSHGSSNSSGSAHTKSSSSSNTRVAPVHQESKPGTPAAKTSSHASVTAAKTSTHASVTAAKTSTQASVTVTVVDPSAPTGAGTITVTREVSIYANVPPGAQRPSPADALNLGAFRSVDSNIGCLIDGGDVRCDVASRAWPTPAKPSSCQLAWGQGLEVGPSTPAHFVCAGDSVLDPDDAVLPNGYDDKVGSITCQSRSIGMTCFDGADRGFYLSHTGYYTF